MELGEKGATHMSLPYNMQTPQNKALGIMFDKQIEKLVRYMKKMCVWSDLDNLDEKYYGIAAKSVRALYYNSENSAEINREIIKNTLKTHMKAGTRSAEEELIGMLTEGGTVQTWDEYDGEPYHFKIQVNESIEEKNFDKFSDVLQKIKSKRSILDDIEYSREVKMNTKIRISSGNINKMEVRDGHTMTRNLSETEKVRSVMHIQYMHQEIRAQEGV